MENEINQALQRGITDLIKGTGEKNDYTVAYFDLEVHAFRSFIIENLLTIYL